MPSHSPYALCNLTVFWFLELLKNQSLCLSLSFDYSTLKLKVFTLSKYLLYSDGKTLFLSIIIALFSFQGTIPFKVFIKEFLNHICGYGGDEENRTPDPLLARQVLSQLSYTP